VHESDEVIERVAMTLRRETVTVSPGFDARVMQHVREESRQRTGLGVWRWVTRPRTIRISPLAGLALAAGLAGVVALAARRDGADGSAAAPMVMTPASVTGQHMMQFIFVNDSASKVAIVGDFNDWDAGVSPLRREEKGVWTITIPLAPGRYQYTFVVDGTTWVPDPAAPRTLEDDFGPPNSVITVGDVTT
jgi:hypothetical protein